MAFDQKSYAELYSGAEGRYAYQVEEYGEFEFRIG